MIYKEDYQYEDYDFEDILNIDNMLDVYYQYKGTSIEEKPVHYIDIFFRYNESNYTDINGDIILAFANKFDAKYNFKSIVNSGYGMYGEHRISPSKLQPIIKERLLTNRFINGVIEKYREYNEMLPPQPNIYKYLGEYLNDVKDKYNVSEKALDKYNSICNYLDYCKDNYKVYEQLTDFENQTYNLYKYGTDVLGITLEDLGSKKAKEIKELEQKISSNSKHI